MNPHVIVVYECVLARFADVVRQLSGRASDLHAVGLIPYQILFCKCVETFEKEVPVVFSVHNILVF